MIVHTGNFYGLLVVSLCALTGLLRDVVLFVLALIMTASWAVDNVLVAWLGFTGAPYIAPSFDAFLAVIVAIIGRGQHSDTALFVLYLFILEEVISITGIAFGQTNTYLYYALLNVVFLLQVLIIGTAAARKIQLVSIGRSLQRLRHRMFGA